MLPLLFIQTATATLKTLGTLLLLLIVLPFNAAVVLLALLWSLLSQSPFSPRYIIKSSQPPKSPSLGDFEQVEMDRKSPNLGGLGGKCRIFQKGNSSKVPLNKGDLGGSASVTHRQAQTSQTQTPSKTVLLTGGKMTKALQLARSFHTAGHRVILAETDKYWLTGHRFSRSVDRFYTVPSPSADLKGYMQALLAIAKTENIDVYVPVCSPAASYYDSLAKSVLSGCCEVFHFDVDVTAMLDDKFAFAEQARSLGLSVPKSFKITDPQQVIDFDFSNETRPYILKSIPYDSVRRLNLTKLPCATPAETAAFVRSLPISAEQPWIMQEFISGQEYCTHSTVRGGELRLHCCCESSAFQVNYANVDKPKILQWVSHFVQALSLTGQASFDFIQADDGAVYAIECNPRTHSAITMFYNHPGVADAYLKSDPLTKPLQPLPSSKATYWLYHELWQLNEVRALPQLLTWFHTIWHGKDAIFSLHDPLPFLMVHHWQMPLLLLDNLRRGKGWIRIDFNIGKLVEPGGD